MGRFPNVPGCVMSVRHFQKYPAYQASFFFSSFLSVSVHESGSLLNMYCFVFFSWGGFYVMLGFREVVFCPGVGFLLFSFFSFLSRRRRFYIIS